MPLVAVLALYWACCCSCSRRASCTISARPGCRQESWVALCCCVEAQLQRPAVWGVLAAPCGLWITAGLGVGLVARNDVQGVINEAEGVSSAAWKEESVHMQMSSRTLLSTQHPGNNTHSSRPTNQQ
jgi:hypothetical protein